MSKSQKTSLPENTLQLDPTSPELPQQPAAFCTYFFGKHKLGLTFMLLMETGQAACIILLPYAIKQIMDAVALAEQSGLPVLDHLAGPLWLLVMLNMGLLLFSRASGAALVLVGPVLRRRVRSELFSYLQHHSQNYFMANFAGALANRIAEVSMSVNHMLWTIMFDFWPLAIIFGVSLALLAGVSSSLALVLGGWIIVFVAVSFLLARQCRHFAKKFAAARSMVSGKIVDSVTNIMNAKMFARRDYERSYLREYLDMEVNTARETYWFMEKMRWFQFSASIVLILSIIGYALHIWTQGGMTTGEFAMAASLSLMIIEQARGLARRFLEFFEYVGNINDGVSIIIRPHDVIDHSNATALKVGKGDITFSDLDFSYNQGAGVFSKLNVTIHPGEKVGLVGFSGSGKSTFVNLILRFFEPQKGKILIDGQNIAHATQDSLRSQISMIPQDPMLFHRSLMENIRYGNLEASDEEVIEAAKEAHAHDFIEETEHGYDSLVGERGVKLSGGQRQRIAIARAILKNAPILLLDEATSALDSVTEKKIQQSLEFLMKNKTVVVIAHRLSTIAHMDRILVFHDGRIIEEGRHDELAHKPEGHYARMWAMQAGGFLPEEETDHTVEELAQSA